MAMRYRANEHADKYTICRCLNTGAFAISYEATDSTGQKVFLKQYKSPSPLVSWYEGYKRHQAKLKAKVLGDKRLAERTYKFIDEYEHKKAFIQVYGFIEGGKDLKEYLAENKMSIEQRFTFASLLLYTLKLFHDAGIVHTDLKPDNVYLMPSDAKMGYNLKLIDFDFTVLDGMKSPWDKNIAVKDGINYCGTPRYMSPEHLRAEMPTAKSDVFTAAIICCELLTRGGHPFPEDESDYRDAVLVGHFANPEFPVKTTPSLTELHDALCRAFSPNASERPNASDLHEILKANRTSFLGVTNKPETKGKIPPKTPPKPPDPTLEETSKGSSDKQGGPKNNQSTPVRRIRLGLSMKGSSETDWFKITTTFGKHTTVLAVKPHRACCSSEQFVLRRDGAAWFIDPALKQPKNMVVFNGEELTTSHKLSDGDIIALGSRKDPTKRNIEPMVVHLENI